MATFKGLFNLQPPKDLLGKLERDFTRLKMAPMDTCAAFDFFVTAEHMLDWIYPNDEGQRRNERSNETLLQACSHLADDSKHFVAAAKRHKSVKDAREETGAFQADFVQADAFDIGKLVAKLNGDAARRLRPSIEVVDLAGRVLDFWKKHRLQP